MGRALAIHVEARIRIDQVRVDRRFDALRGRAKVRRITGASQLRGNQAHEYQGAVVEGIHHGVDRPEVIVVTFALGPIDKVLQLSAVDVLGIVHVERVQELICDAPGTSADQAVLAGELAQRLRLQVVVELGDGSRIAGLHVVGPGHQH